MPLFPDKDYFYCRQFLINRTQFYDDRNNVLALYEDLVEGQMNESYSYYYSRAIHALSVHNIPWD
jgi:hypothetical protein